MTLSGIKNRNGQEIVDGVQTDRYRTVTDFTGGLLFETVLVHILGKSVSVLLDLFLRGFRVCIVSGRSFRSNNGLSLMNSGIVISETKEKGLSSCPHSL